MDNKAITKLHIIMVAIIAIIVIISAVIFYYWMFLAKPSVERPIKVGALLELTGGLALYGYSHEKVLSAAIRKINEEGGINGRRVELYVENDETDVTTGVARFRKLVEYWDVDFILGPNHSGIAIACASLAKEYKTVFFANIGAVEFTGEKGNRYVFRLCSNIRQEVKAAVKWGILQLGTKWATLVADYSWGWSYEKEFADEITKQGGKVLAAIRAPLGTKDFMPHIVKIPPETDAVLIAFFGTDLLTLLKDLHVARPGLKKLIGTYGLTGIRTEDIADILEGTCIIGPFPRRLESLNTPYTREFRKLVGMDEEGSEVGNPARVYAHAYNFAVWEAMFALKRAIEVSGWKSKEDNPALIKALEGMRFKESLEFPQGDKFIRAEDHQAFLSIYIERVTGGKLTVAGKIPPEDTIYPPEVDYTKEPF